MDGIDAQHAVQRLFDPVEEDVDTHRRTAHQPCQVQAQRPCQRQAGQKNEGGFNHDGAPQNDSGRRTAYNR